MADGFIDVLIPTMTEVKCEEKSDFSSFIRLIFISRFIFNSLLL